MENIEEGLVSVYYTCYPKGKLAELASTAIKLAGFPPGEAAPRQRELLWECALASERKKLSLSVFLSYVDSIVTRGFIPITFRP